MLADARAEADRLTVNASPDAGERQTRIAAGRSSWSDEADDIRRRAQAKAPWGGWLRDGLAAEAPTDGGL